MSPSPTFIPRRHRDHARAFRAMQAAKAEGASALEQALIGIGQAGSRAAIVNKFKLHVEHVIAWGSKHPGARARYGWIVDDLPLGATLDGAVALVERRYQAEIARRSSQALTRMTLSEARLLLRMVRRFAPERFAEILDHLSTPAWARIPDGEAA